MAPALFFISLVGTLALRLIGYQQFENNWSLTHWLYQPVWYNVIWGVLFVSALVWAFLKSGQIASFFNSTLRRLAGLLVVLILIFLFQFDSILFAGGNLRVAQLAQTDFIIHRWYEYGSSLIVTSFFELYKLIGIVANTAAVFAWNSLLWISTLFSLWGTILITGELTRRSDVRFWLFFIIFFGSQSLAQFGLMGSEVTIIPITIWFAFLSVKAQKNSTIFSMAAMWGILILGCFLNFSAAYLFPATAYLTTRGTLQLKKWSLAATIATLLSLALWCFLLYHQALNNLEFSRNVLFLEGKSPFLSYGLFSPRHISDVAQILFLTTPTILLTIYFFIVEPRKGANIYLSTLCWVMALSGLVVLFVSNPINSVVLDLPKLVVYLTPLGILLASYVRSAGAEQDRPVRLPAMLAVASIFFTFTYLPVYSFIRNADSYVKDYFEEQPPFYISGGLAMRDAYFMRKDFDHANKWEQSLPIKSQDYLGMDGASNLALRGEFDGALEELYHLKTKYPFWVQPRELIADIQLRVKQFDKAKAEIDTLLMLEPYKKAHYGRLNTYYFSTRNFTAALDATNKALELFPEDKGLLVDKLTCLYNSGQAQQTDSLARDLIRIDSNLAYPYMFLGLIQQKSGNKQLAAKNYGQFLKLLPDAPDAPQVRKLLNDIVLENSEKKDSTSH